MRGSRPQLARETAPTRWYAIQANASGGVPAMRRIEMTAASVRSRRASAASVIVAVADVDPLQSIGRPHPAPAIIVPGVDIGPAKQSEATVAMMQQSAPRAP